MGVRRFIKHKVKSLAKSALGRGEAAGDGPQRSLPTEPDTEGFVAVCATEDVRHDHPGIFGVGDDIVAVFRTTSGLYAIDNACAHEDGPLGEGELEGDIVICPYHDWRYDVTTGECLSEEGRRQACFAVRDRDGWIWVGPRTKDGSTLRGGEHDDGLATKPIN